MHRTIAEVAGHRALAEAMDVRRPWNDRPRAPRIRTPRRAPAVGKICNALTRNYLVPPGEDHLRLLDDPTPTCLMYCAVPDAPEDAAVALSAAAQVQVGMCCERRRLALGVE